MLTDSDITALKSYFENRKDITFAFLFGVYEIEKYYACYNNLITKGGAR